MPEAPATRFEWRGRLQSDFRNQFEAKTDGGDEFDYWIKVDKVGILDPRVRIIESNELRKLRDLAIDEMLQDNFDTTADKLIETRSSE